MGQSAGNEAEALHPPTSGVLCALRYGAPLYAEDVEDKDQIWATQPTDI